VRGLPPLFLSRLLLLFIEPDVALLWSVPPVAGSLEIPLRRARRFD
jgi:hypothetical protein